MSLAEIRKLVRRVPSPNSRVKARSLLRLPVETNRSRIYVPMLARARRSVRETHIGNIGFCLADAARLPLRDESVDVAVVNGIFNLNPSRSSIFKELARTVRPGGAVFAAELVVREPLPPEVRANARSWFA